MYAKFKNEKEIQVASNPIRITISNPTDEQYRFAGYKQVIELPVPEYDHKTQYLEGFYEKDNTYIYKKWEVKDLPTKEDEQESLIGNKN